MNWNDVFEYREGRIYWKVRTSNRINVGDEFGGVCKTWGYVVGKFMGKTTRAHRVIWEMFNGKIPEGMEIDHINHIRHDNRIENLRLVDGAENSKNRSMQSNNKTGVTGVNWNKANKKWTAKITHGKKQMYIGSYESFDDAVRARIDMEIEIGFHKNHGVNL